MDATSNKGLQHQTALRASWLLIFSMSNFAALWIISHLMFLLTNITYLGFSKQSASQKFNHMPSKNNNIKNLFTLTATCNDNTAGWFPDFQRLFSVYIQTPVSSNSQLSLSFLCSAVPVTNLGRFCCSAPNLDHTFFCNILLKWI